MQCWPMICWLGCSSRKWGESCLMHCRKASISLLQLSYSMAGESEFVMLPQLSSTSPGYLWLKVWHVCPGRSKSVVPHSHFSLATAVQFSWQKQTGIAISSITCLTLVDHPETEGVVSHSSCSGHAICLLLLALAGSLCS